jgi:hypothetical protein
MTTPIKKASVHLEKTVDVVTRHKMVLWGRFALRASVVTLAIAAGALLFRDLDLGADLSFLEVNILSGSPEGQYHAAVERLAHAAAAQRGTIHNTASRGSRDNLERLAAARENCEVQFGLVQDGFDWSKYPGVELIGRVGRTEAVMLLGREADRIRRLTDLRGLRIGVGPENSGSAFLAERLLSTPDLTPLNIALEHHSLKRQVELAASGQLDLALFVMDEDAALIRSAVRDQGLQIVGLDHTEALARRFDFVNYGTLVAGQYDAVRVLPPRDKPSLRLDTLLLSNGCAAHSDVIGLMTLVARAYPRFIERNRNTQAPTDLELSESARGFFENQGAEFADEHVPWLVDIMPPSNWVYTIMAVSLFFNLAGFVNSQRLALIDLNRVALENDLGLLFGQHLSNEEIRLFDPAKAGRDLNTGKLEKVIAGYRRHLDKCRRQSLSILSPLGEEMGYRDQEIIMTATLDALRELRQRLVDSD